MNLRSNSSAVLGLALAALALPALVSAPAQAAGRQTVSSGTVITVKLDNDLSSSNANRGDTFTATVTSDSTTGIPAGSKVDGVVRSVTAQQDKNPGILDIDFNRVTLTNGRSYAISGSPISLDNKSVTRKNGRLVAKNQNKGPSRLTYVGIGAGAGLLVNILAHRKGTIMDTILGAAAGYGAGSLIKSGSTPKDVNLKSGTKIGIQLDRSISIYR